MTERRKKERRKDMTTPEQLMRAIRLATGFGVLALVAVGIALTVFVISARAERAELCEVISDVSLGQAHALIRATEPERPLSPEESERRERVVALYLNAVEANLGRCK